MCCDSGHVPAGSPISRRFRSCWVSWMSARRCGRAWPRAWTWTSVRSSANTCRTSNWRGRVWETWRGEENGEIERDRWKEKDEKEGMWRRERDTGKEKREVKGEDKERVKEKMEMRDAGRDKTREVKEKWRGGKKRKSVKQPRTNGKEVRREGNGWKDLKGRVREDKEKEGDMLRMEKWKRWRQKEDTTRERERETDKKK